MHIKGHGGPKNYAAAITMYDKAIARGYNKAEEIGERLLSKLEHRQKQQIADSLLDKHWQALLDGFYCGPLTMLLLKSHCQTKVFELFLDDNSMCGTSIHHLSQVISTENSSPLQDIVYADNRLVDFRYDTLKSRKERIVEQRRTFLRGTYSQGTLPCTIFRPHFWHQESMSHKDVYRHIMTMAHPGILCDKDKGLTCHR